MKALLATLLAPVYCGLFYFASQANHWAFSVLLGPLAVGVALFTVSMIKTKKRKRR